jgi:hypothetical protein
MRIAVEHPEIECQHDQNKNREAAVKPPVISERKQVHRRIMEDGAGFDHSTIPNESLGKNELSRAGRGHHF